MDTPPIDGEKLIEQSINKSSGLRMVALPGSTGGTISGGSGDRPARSEGKANRPRDVGPLPAFLDRTFAMVDEASSDDVVGWAPNGDTFLIKRLDLFEEQVIPRFFNHRNLFSFVRQLNNHGEERRSLDRA